MASEIEERLRERISVARKQANLKQSDVESKLGFSAGTLSKIESGQREISGAELAELAALCGRNVGWFFQDTSEASPVHFRGEIGDDESRRDLAWLNEFATSYQGLLRRVS